MPTVKFTVRSLDALKPPSRGRVDYWDVDMPGFGLRISSQGRRTWTVMYRQDGQQRRFKLGTHPPLSLADAREKASDVLHAVAHGKDPSAERSGERQADTIKELGELYIERYAKPNKKSWKVDQGILNRDIIPRWGKRKASSIRRRDVLELIDAIVERGAPIMANRTFELVRQLFNFAVAREIVEVSPCFGVLPGQRRPVVGGERCASGRATAHGIKVPAPRP